MDGSKLAIQGTVCQLPGEHDKLANNLTKLTRKKYPSILPERHLKFMYPTNIF